MRVIKKSFFSPIPHKIRERLMLEMRIENSKRILLISAVGLLFFFLFCGLDYIRYTTGKIQEWNIYFFLFFNHLCFALFIFPVITILKNRKAFDVGQFRHGRFFIYTWTLFLGAILLIMATLSLVERSDLSLYYIYIIIANFGLIMLHRDRILLNLASLIIIASAIIVIDQQDIELLLVHLMEAAGVTGLSFIVSTHIFNTYVWRIIIDKILKRKNKRIAKERKRGNWLLNNILPKEIAVELMQNGMVKPRFFRTATILMMDFKNFSGISNMSSPEQLIADLDYCFKKFDQIAEKYHVEKIKTIGDAYLCVSGVPKSDPKHPFNCIKAAHEMIVFLDKWKEERRKLKKPLFEGRFGIHTGPVIAGVVGERKFAYDIWGDTVNVCARMESSGEVGRINISQTTYELVKSKYQCTHRGKIEIKNQEPMDMYFVEG